MAPRPTTGPEPVEQAQQAGTNPAAPAGEGAAPPAQDTAPGLEPSPEAALGDITAQLPEVPSKGTDGTPPEADASGGSTPGGVPPVAAVVGAAGGDGSHVGLAPDTRPMVVVRGPVAGRWRAGRRFGPELTRIPAEELTDAEIGALLADPALMVQFA